MNLRKAGVGTLVWLWSQVANCEFWFPHHFTCTDSPHSFDVLTWCCMLLQVNYFPSRFDPCRHAEQYPIPPRVLTGKREKVTVYFIVHIENLVFWCEVDFHKYLYYPFYLVLFPPCGLDCKPWRVYCSASLRKRTTSSSQESITDLGHRTGSLVPLLFSLTNFPPLSSKYLSAGLVIAGKKDLSADGLMLYPILEPLMKFAVFGFHTGHRSEFFTLHVSLVPHLSWRTHW